jgi:hypothetical protein
VDELGVPHDSGHHLNITTWEVFNEPDYEHGHTPESYTLEFDAIVAGIRRHADPNRTIKFVGMNNPNIDDQAEVVRWARFVVTLRITLFFVLSLSSSLLLMVANTMVHSCANCFRFGGGVVWHWSQHRIIGRYCPSQAVDVVGRELAVLTLLCACVCVRANVHACVCVCVCACVHGCMRACAQYVRLSHVRVGGCVIRASCIVVVLCTGLSSGAATFSTRRITTQTCATLWTVASSGTTRIRRRITTRTTKTASRSGSSTSRSRQ